MLFSLSFLYTAVAIEEDSLDYDDVMRTFRSLLTLEGRRRRAGFVPRASLQAHMASSWRYLYETDNDQALITKTGFDHKVFSDLNNLFSPVFRWYSPWTEDGFVKRLTNPDEGKPRILDSAGCLGLVLSWYRTRGTAKKTLCMTFGLTPSHLCVWLRFSK